MNFLKVYNASETVARAKRESDIIRETREIFNARNPPCNADSICEGTVACINKELAEEDGGKANTVVDDIIESTLAYSEDVPFESSEIDAGQTWWEESASSSDESCFTSPSSDDEGNEQFELPKYAPLAVSDFAVYKSVQAWMDNKRSNRLQLIPSDGGDILSRCSNLTKVELCAEIYALFHQHTMQW